MKFRYIAAVALFALGLKGTAWAECKVVDVEAVAAMAKYGAATSVCPGYKKPMDNVQVLVLLGLGGYVTGVREALQAQGSEPMACQNAIVPFIEAKKVLWLAADRQFLCSSAKNDIDKADSYMQDLFRKFGVID
jgi:hypothetical protein